MLEFHESFSSCHLDEDASSNTPEPPRSDSSQDQKNDKEPLSHPSSNRGSTQSLRNSRGEITATDVETRIFSLIAPPPREPGSRAKSRCSTLPSRHKGAEACYSLPRPSHSTSLTKFQQKSTLAALVPLPSSSSASPNPFSPPHTPVSSSPQSPLAPKPQTSRELFVLKGPPPQLPRSRGKSRCATLPPRQRPPGPEEPSIKPSHSTSDTKLEDRIPLSPSELKQNTTHV